jgi:hypothetical protein
MSGEKGKAEDRGKVERVRLVGKVEVYLDGRKVAESKNALNYCIPVNLAFLAADQPMNQQYPGYPVKVVGLYGTDGALKKTLPRYSIGDTTETAADGTYYFAVVTFMDTSADSYTFNKLMLYSLPYGWPDDPSNYMVVAKAELASAVTKQSAQMMTVRWKIGIKYAMRIGAVAVDYTLAKMIKVSLEEGTGMVQPSDVELYDANQAKIKSLPISSKSWANDTANMQFVTTLILYDTSTDTYSAYYVERPGFFHIALPSPIQKTTDPLMIQVTLGFGYDFSDSTTGIRSTYG